MIAWIILIIENIFLTLFFLIWINRHCRQCHKVKCLERAFNKTCQTCQNKPFLTKKKSPKETSKF